MPQAPEQPRTMPEPSSPDATPESVRASVIVERRRFPRELPKADVVELNSDSAWLPFQALADAGADAPPPEPNGSPAH